MSEIGVYKAIAQVTSAMAKEGISKGRKNQTQGYSFRGIDDVYNVLSGMLADAGLCIIPRILSRDLQERQTKNGGTLFYVTVEAEYDLVSAEDGSKHTAKVFGEAMDSADKATNKAMSAAYKYMAFQTFAIPTEGDNDADSHTPVVAPAAKPAPAKPMPAKVKEAAAALKPHAKGTISGDPSESDLTGIAGDVVKPTQEVIGKIIHAYASIGFTLPMLEKEYGKPTSDWVENDIPDLREMLKAMKIEQANAKTAAAEMSGDGVEI